MKKEPFWPTGSVDADKLISKEMRERLYSDLSSAMSEIIEGDLMDRFVSRFVIDALKQSWKGREENGAEGIAIEFNGTHIVAVPSVDMSELGFSDKRRRLSTALRQALMYPVDPVDLAKAEKELSLCLRIIRAEMARPKRD